MITFDAAAHEYRSGGRRVTSVTQAISGAGLVDSRWFDDYSRDRGTAVHRATELFDLEVLDEESLDPILLPYLDGYKMFILETGAAWDAIERRVYSSTHHYAGTLDRLGFVNGRRTLVDLKTGGIYPTTALQLAAYCHAADEVCDRMAVQLNGDGKYSIHLYKIEDLTRDFGVFAAALTVANWKENNK